MLVQPASKVCSICCIDLPLERFYVGKGGKYGRESYCKDCYREKRRAGVKRKPGPIDWFVEISGTRECKHCGVVKDLSEFRKHQKKSGDYVPGHVCKPCAYARLDPGPRIAAKLRSYGLTVAEYDSMLERADYKCEACAKPLKRAFGGHQRKDVACVDHCHATGVVRGILCLGCNSAMGHLADSAQRVEGLYRYVKRHGQLQLVG